MHFITISAAGGVKDIREAACYGNGLAGEGRRTIVFVDVQLPTKASAGLLFLRMSRTCSPSSARPPRTPV
jgi:hypothetical protein